MDDFFKRGAEGIAVLGAEDIAETRETLHSRDLELWVVLYQHQLDLPVGPYLKESDVVTFWTWTSEDINKLEENLSALNCVAPGMRKMLGCYMWDYGNDKPMPLPLMERQCDLGLKLLKDGAIEGMIFLASCICDLKIEAVEWTREWIKRQPGGKCPACFF